MENVLFWEYIGKNNTTGLYVELIQSQILVVYAAVV